MYSTNPFLQMLAAIGDDEDLQQLVGVVAVDNSSSRSSS